MAQPPAAPATWDEDPSGVSILLATGRARHDLLVVADPALLSVLDSAWGRPSARVRLSFLPGVSAPVTSGQEDALVSYDRDGLSILVARGRTSPIEGKPARSNTALARIVGAAGVRAALLVARASSLGAAAPGDLLAIGDHINLSCAPLFPADQIISAGWDEALTSRLARLRGVRGMGVVALTPGGEVAAKNGSKGSGNQMALANVRERLALFYDLEARMETRLQTASNGQDEFRVHIRLPCRSEDL